MGRKKIVAILKLQIPAGRRRLHRRSVRRWVSTV